RRELAVIYRTRYDDWTLPKGKLNAGENWQEAALREVWEETGCRARVINFAGCVSYVVQNVPKVVLYWNMKLIEDGHFRPNGEVDRRQWLRSEEAIQRLTYVDEKELVQKNLNAW
ncbi:MAG: NUDIX domain-containing protein, partial [candidate division KSB1 bacterium]|nr:NUDIX domain-containing protein [candidate division KSB1 bacterium]